MDIQLSYVFTQIYNTISIHVYISHLHYCVKNTYIHLTFTAMYQEYMHIFEVYNTVKNT